MVIIYSKVSLLIMHDYPKNNAFWDYNLKLHGRMNMHSKYDNVHKNGMFYALIWINNHVIIIINFILSPLVTPCHLR